MKGSQRLEQVIQGGCGVSVLGSTHELTQPWITHPTTSVSSRIWRICFLDVSTNINCSMVQIWNIFKVSVVVLLWL